MKRHLLPIMLAITALLSLGMFTSCGDDGPWYDGPGGWDNSFYDNRLIGTWELIQANESSVGPNDTNYLYFRGEGRGTYYYQERGQRYSEPLSYYCQESSSPSSMYQINLKYGNGNPTTMTYWFTNSGNSLWLQWLTNSGTITYLYQAVNGVPW